MDFEYRFNFKPVRDNFLIDNISNELKNRVWSFIYKWFFSSYIKEKSDFEFYETIIEDIWSNFCKYPLDEFQNKYIPTHRTQNVNKIQKYIDEKEWYQIYKLVEFLLKNEFVQELLHIKDPDSTFIKNLNITLREVRLSLHFN